MTVFPNAKINFGLRITSRRADGFHNIETIFYPVGVHDALEFVAAPVGDDSDSMTNTGFQTGVRMADNIITRALSILREHYDIPALNIHLHKAIPVGAGLGGGSADAIFMLRYLDRYFKLGITDNNLIKFALQLGSDCPFFIDNKPAYARGRGEILKDIDPFLQGYHLIIIHPGIHVSTAEAYSMSKPLNREEELPELARSTPDEWPGSIINDFEVHIFKKFPEIARIKAELYDLGALYSSMSGSGSAVYGLFREKPPADKIRGSHWTWCGKL